MIKRMIEQQIASFETEWNYPMDYAREVLGLGALVFKKFFDAAQIGEYCEGISKPASFAAKILAVMAGDCGPCVQLVVDMAVREGVPPEALAQLVSGELDALPDDLRLTAQFTRALLDRSDALPELRDRMREHYGTAGLVSVAFAVINASMYPTLKYALGYGQSCAPIAIGTARILPTKVA